MFKQVLLREALKSQLDQSKKLNPRLGLRYFARKISVSPSTLSDFLAGKRNLSSKMALKIIPALSIPKLEREKYKSLFLESKPHTGVKSFDRLKIQESDYEKIHDWIHFAILSLFETRDFQQDTTWIASRLNVCEIEVAEAIERLLRMNYLSQCPETSKLGLTFQGVSSPDGVPSEAIKKAHKNNLFLAQKALEKQEINERDFTSMTMAVDKTKIFLAKNMIRDFLNNLTAVLESGEKSEVYKVSIQLFSLTN